MNRHIKLEDNSQIEQLPKLEEMTEAEQKFQNTMNIEKLCVRLRVLDYSKLYS